MPQCLPSVTFSACQCCCFVSWQSRKHVAALLQMLKAVQRLVAAKQGLTVTYNISSPSGAGQGAVQRAEAARRNVLQKGDTKYFYEELECAATCDAR
jgi:hypothetical protein